MARNVEQNAAIPSETSHLLSKCPPDDKTGSVHMPTALSHRTSAVSSVRLANVLVNLTCAQIVNSFATGVLTVAIPVIARDVGLAVELVFWPQAVYSLTCTCCLIPFGAISDVFGAKKTFLLGCTLLCAMNVACGRAGTGSELIAFRACLGIGTAMCMPTAISMISRVVAATDELEVQQAQPEVPSRRSQKETHRRKTLRSLGLAMQGLGLPLGFSLGLLLGGFFTNSSLTWRFAFYLNAGINAVIVIHGLFTLPHDPPRTLSLPVLLDKLDILGVLLSAAILGTLLTALAFVAAEPANIRTARVIGLIVTAVVLSPAFPYWMRFRAARGKTALLPNHIWSNRTFSCVCLMVFLSWAAVQSFEIFMSLFYQDVQLLSAQQASVRFIPDVVLGIIINLLTGLGLSRVYVYPLTLSACLIGCSAPLIMALANPAWSYWYAIFWAVLLSPVSVDVLFTVGATLITSTFPADRQAMGGAVFSTSSQLGVSLGLAIFAVISSAVSNSNAHSSDPESGSKDLLHGYRAGFWAMFACSVLSLLIGALSLRNIADLGIGRKWSASRA